MCDVHRDRARRLWGSCDVLMDSARASLGLCDVHRESVCRPWGSCDVRRDHARRLLVRQRDRATFAGIVQVRLLGACDAHTDSARRLLERHHHRATLTEIARAGRADRVTVRSID